jgi:hypothetical protein
MNKRIATAVAVFGAAGVISGCELKQPEAGCIVQDASVAAWQASYIPKTEADAAKSCGKLKGEQLGVWKFSDPEASEAQISSNTASSLSIRPRRLASLTRMTYSYPTGEKDPVTGELVIDEDTGEPVEKSVTVTRVPQDKWANATTSSATMPEMPDAEGFCKATGFSQASITVEAVTNEKDSSKVEFPAASRTYQYGDIEVYSHPSAPGTQLRGTLTYTEGDCTAEYNVLALWPSVGCDPKAEDKPENAAVRCGAGSGLNPDFKAVCVAGIGAGGAAACVPDPAVGLTLVGKK